MSVSGTPTVSVTSSSSSSVSPLASLTSSQSSFATSSAQASVSASPSASASQSSHSSSSGTPSTSASKSPSASFSSEASLTATKSSSPSSSGSGSSSPSPHSTMSDTPSSSSYPTSSSSSSPRASISAAPSSTPTSSSSVSQTSMASSSAFASSSATRSSSASASAIPSIPTFSAAASSSSSSSPSTSSSSYPSSSATTSRSGTATSTASGTSTSTFQFPDPQSPTPTPRPIVNVALSMANVQLSLFRGNAAQLSSTLTSLEIAVSSAAGVDPSSVSIRRVRDISDPFVPIVIWTNPQYAGDVFPARRRLQGGSTGSVSIDIQIKTVNNAAASALSASLVASSKKLASDIQESLITQGSPLSTSQIIATVEPYERSLSENASSSSSQTTAIGVTVPLILGAIAVTSYLWFRYKKLKHKSLSAIAPEELIAKKEEINGNKINGDDDPSHLESLSQQEDATELVNDLKLALKAQQEANMHERMYQLKALKAKVAKIQAIRSESESPFATPTRNYQKQEIHAEQDTGSIERISQLKALKAKVASGKLESPLRKLQKHAWEHSPSHISIESSIPNSPEKLENNELDDERLAQLKVLKMKFSAKRKADLRNDMDTVYADIA